MIAFEDVSYSYEPGKPVCDGVRLDLRQGLTLVVGPNGSGKSTLMKLASGVEKPDRGRILVDGHDLWKEETAARQRLAYLPEFPDLTPYARLDEVVDLVCRLRGRPAAEGADALEFFELRDLAHLTVRELSLGQRRRAVFAAVMVGPPPNILLDEPLDGMDRAIQERILAWIMDRLRSGAAVAVVSHTLEPFAAAVSRIVSMKRGEAACFDELPGDAESRLELIGRLAKGLEGETG